MVMYTVCMWVSVCGGVSVWVCALNQRGGVGMCVQVGVLVLVCVLLSYLNSWICVILIYLINLSYACNWFIILFKGCTHWPCISNTSAIKVFK